MIQVDSPTTVTNNYYGDPNKPATPATPAPSTMGTLAKLAIAGGLISTGAGAGIGIPMLLDGLKDGKAVIDQRADDAPSPVYTIDLGSPND